MSASGNYANLPTEVSDALETLYQAVVRADAAFVAVASRIQGEGKAQRLAAGAWVVMQATPSVTAEPGGSGVVTTEKITPKNVTSVPSEGQP